MATVLEGYSTEWHTSKDVQPPERGCQFATFSCTLLYMARAQNGGSFDSLREKSSRLSSNFRERTTHLVQKNAVSPASIAWIQLHAGRYNSCCTDMFSVNPRVWWLHVATMCRKLVLTYCHALHWRLPNQTLEKHKLNCWIWGNQFNSLHEQYCNSGLGKSMKKRHFWEANYSWIQHHNVSFQGHLRLFVMFHPFCRLQASYLARHPDLGNPFSAVNLTWF